MGIPDTNLHDTLLCRAIHSACTRWLFVLCILTTLAAGFGAPTEAARKDTAKPLPFAPADRLDSHVAVRWFDLLYTLIRTEKLSPPAASRVIGCIGVTLYESIVPGIPGHRSLAGELNALPALPQADARTKYDWRIVANAALASELRGLFTAASQDSRAAIDALEESLRQETGRNIPPPVLASSAELGQHVAAAILAWSETDRFATYDNCSYTPSLDEGMWEPTPPAFRPALQPCWGQLRPFALISGTECGAAAPPAFSTTQGSDFYNEGLEVYETSKNLTGC